MKRILLTILLICTYGQNFSQNPLNSFTTTDGLVMGVGVFLDAGLRLIKTKNKNPTGPSKIKSSYENIAVRNLSLKAKKGSDIFLFGVAPAGYLGSQFVYDDPQRSVYLTFQSILITDIANLLAKKLVKRRRPFTYNQDVIGGDKCHAYNRDHTNANLSFYSGHTAHVASFVFFTNTMLWYYKPDFRTNDWAWIASAMIPAVVGYQRVRAGKHFPSDVMAGYLAGAAIGYLIPKIHENENQGSDLTEDFLIGVGAGMLAQFLLIKIFGGKNPKQDCVGKHPSTFKLHLSPMLGQYTGLRVGIDFNN